MSDIIKAIKAWAVQDKHGAVWPEMHGIDPTLDPPEYPVQEAGDPSPCGTEQRNITTRRKAGARPGGVVSPDEGSGSTP